MEEEEFVLVKISAEYLIECLIDNTQLLPNLFRPRNAAIWAKTKTFYYLLL